MSEKANESMQRYVAAGHKVQTALAVLISHDPTYAPVQSKHMRTGVDMRASDHAGLAALLMGKGIITEDEYLEAIAGAAELEALRYEHEVQNALGSAAIKLG